jgi:hypothetical protein
MAFKIPELNKPSKASSKKPAVPPKNVKPSGTKTSTAAEDRRLQNLNPKNPSNQITSLKGTLTKLDTRISTLNNSLTGLNGVVGSALGVFFEGKYYTFAKARELLAGLRSEKSWTGRALNDVKGAVSPGKSGKDKTSSNTPAKKPPKNSNRTDDTTTDGGGGGGALGKPVIYNAAAANDVYFKIDQSLFKTQTDPNGYARGATGIDSNIYSGNTPKAVVLDAIDLWKNSSSGKGMIQTWISKNGTSPNFSAGQSSAQFGDQSTFQKYGFQFIYNPETITLDYGGVPAVDLGQITSGNEEYNNLNPMNFQSSISFNILLNRIFDMQYIGPGGALKGNLDVSKIYSGKIPTDKDLEKIYNRGTMYDVEFLLQTMFGTDALKTDLRGKTWDVGYLGPSPVELHLGNNLRYVVLIQSIQVQHALFDHRMVPMFSYVSFSCRRIPDFTAGVVADASKSSSNSISSSTSSSSLPTGFTTADAWDRKTKKSKGGGGGAGSSFRRL